MANLLLILHIYSQASSGSQCSTRKTWIRNKKSHTIWRRGENERFHNSWLGFFFCVLISSVIIIIDRGFIAITQPRVDYGVSRLGGISSQDRFLLQNVRALLMWYTRNGTCQSWQQTRGRRARARSEESEEKWKFVILSDAWRKIRHCLSSQDSLYRRRLK